MSIKIGDKFQHNTHGQEVIIVEINSLHDSVKIKYNSGFTSFVPIETLLQYFSPVSTQATSGSQASQATPAPITTTTSGIGVGGASGARITLPFTQHPDPWPASHQFSLFDFADEVTKTAAGMVSAKCDCGTHKTYGTDCDISFHSSWCELLQGKF
jgi:hypothetical protein